MSSPIVSKQSPSKLGGDQKLLQQRLHLTETADSDSSLLRSKIKGRLPRTTPGQCHKNPNPGAELPHPRRDVQPRKATVADSARFDENTEEVITMDLDESAILKLTVNDSSDISTIVER
jgi:hypothetical protein